MRLETAHRRSAKEGFSGGRNHAARSISRISISAVADANAPTRLPELQGVAPDVSLANRADQPGGDKIDRQRTSRESLWIELERAHCPAARFTAGGFLGSPQRS